jgi:hypothetical protein
MVSIYNHSLLWAEGPTALRAAGADFAIETVVGVAGCVLVRGADGALSQAHAASPLGATVNILSTIREQH